MDCLHPIFIATAYHSLLKDRLPTTETHRLYKNTLKEEAKWESKLWLNAKRTGTHYTEMYFYLYGDLK